MALIILFILLALFLKVAYDRSRDGTGFIIETSGHVESKISLPPVPPKRRYYKNEDFLTLSEKKFFNTLKQIIKDEFLIFPQVNLASLVQVDAGRWETYKYRNPINRKTVDFCIFKKQVLEPLLVIELDDFTHFRSDRVVRDRNVDKVLEQAGIPILHIKTKDSENIVNLSKQIFEKINGKFTLQ